MCAFGKKHDLHLCRNNPTLILAFCTSRWVGVGINWLIPRCAARGHIFDKKDSPNMSSYLMPSHWLSGRLGNISGSIVAFPAVLKRRRRFLSCLSSASCLRPRMKPCWLFLIFGTNWQANGFSRPPVRLIGVSPLGPVEGGGLRGLNSLHRVHHLKPVPSLWATRTFACMHALPVGTHVLRSPHPYPLLPRRQEGGPRSSSLEPGLGGGDVLWTCSRRLQLDCLSGTACRPSGRTAQPDTETGIIKCFPHTHRPLLLDINFTCTQQT